MTAWPAYAVVEADGYEVVQDTDVRRTAFESGAVRQARRSTSALLVRIVRVHLDSDADLARFRAWAARHAHRWFAWRDPHDGVLRRARVRGGAGAIRYTARSPTQDRRYWAAALEIEGLEADRI